jgi:hypothetical protein
MIVTFELASVLVRECGYQARKRSAIEAIYARLGEIETE